MKIVLGLEHRANSNALSLVNRLRFDHANLDLTHIVPPISWAPSGVYGGYAGEAVIGYANVLEIERKEEEDAKTMLSSFAESMASKEGECTTYIGRGNPTSSLMEHADASHTDLLAINAAHQGPILAFLTGSVAWGLVSGAKQSVLLARENPRGKEDTERPVRAVLATDHSPYMDRCIEQFLRFRPHGLEHLTILTAYPEDNLNELKDYMPDLSISPAEAVRRDLEERNRTLVRRLNDVFNPFQVKITSQVSGESVDCAIQNAMERTGSELLIVGAHGHSLLERLTLGSVSFRQAMTSPYSVLVLRVDSEETAAIRTTQSANRLPQPVALAA